MFSRMSTSLSVSSCGPARRLIAVVGGKKLEHPAFHAAGVVDPVESRIDPELHLAPTFLYRAGKGCRDAEADVPIGYTADRGGGGDRCGWRGGGGGGERRCDSSGRTWPGPDDRPLKISELAVRLSAIDPSRRHGATAVRDIAIEQLRQAGALRLAGRGFRDHSRELIDDELNAGARDVRAGQRRTDNRSDTAGKIAYQVRLVARRCLSSVRKHGTK
jgi:hypothetical protein